jgi:hypothetical protein
MNIWDDDDKRIFKVLKQNPARTTKLLVLMFIAAAGLPTCFGLLIQMKLLASLFVCIVGMTTSEMARREINQIIKEAEALHE